MTNLNTMLNPPFKLNKSFFNYFKSYFSKIIRVLKYLEFL